MPLGAHPGRLLKRELKARALSANRLALDLGVPSGRITDILNERRGITADTAVRLGRSFGNRAQFWLDLQRHYDIAPIDPERFRVVCVHGMFSGGACVMAQLPFGGSHTDKKLRVLEKYLSA